MQLPLEFSSNPTAEAAEPSSPPKVAPISDTFLGRPREPPTLLKMLDDLSDSPARRARDVAAAIGDPFSVGPQAPVLMDATMDGRDPPMARRHLTCCEFIVVLFSLL